MRIFKYVSSAGVLGVLGTTGVLTRTVKVPSLGGESSSSEDLVAAINGESVGSCDSLDPLASGICTESVGTAVAVS